MPRYIDADALLVSAYHLPYSYNGAAWLQVINDAPTADVVPVVRGEWADTNWMNGYGQCLCECSICEQKEPDTKNKNFCPNCGADMRRESEVEE